MNQDNSVKKSFIKKTVMLLTADLIAILVMLAGYIAMTYYNTREAVSASSSNVIRLYENELKNKIVESQNILEQIVYDSNAYTLMQSPKENERFYASKSIKDMLSEVILNQTRVDLAVVADGKYGTILDAERQSQGFALRNIIRDFVYDQAINSTEKSQWRITKFKDKDFIYKNYVWHGYAAGVFISLNNFLESSLAGGLADMCVLITDADGNVYADGGELKLNWESGQPLNREQIRGLIRGETQLEGTQYKLVYYTEFGDFVGRMDVNAVVVLIFIAVSFAFGTALMRSVRKNIIVPMQMMQLNMQLIQNGDYNHRIEDSYNTVEFDNLKKSFNLMMDEIVDLKIADYEKQLVLQDSELKTWRLTLKPHFFLNALTTISSLSMSGKNAEIKEYIDALSKNVRYMFKSGLHTVSLGEEIRHVENYFEMQELKYPGCVFHFTSIEPELEEWRIPQMLLHTIIENEYKYAVSVDKMLSILIKVYKTVDQLLCIEIEDDGKGYPQNVLDDFRNGTYSSNDGTRVGLWGIRRILSLMYERDDLFEISNIEPHGCFNRLLIPEEPVVEARI